MSTASITFTNSHTPIPKDSGIPILGCLPEFAKNPLNFFKRLTRDYDDVVEFHLPFMDMALVVDADIAHKILVTDAKRFRKADRDVNIMGTILGNGLVTNNDIASHKVHRKLVQPGFHFRRMEAYTKTMSEYTEQYISNWKDGTTRNISDDMFKLTLYIVTKTLFDTDMGEMENEADRVGNTMKTVQDLINKRFLQILPMPDWVPSPSNLKLAKARKNLHQTIEHIIDTKTTNNGEIKDNGDMMSMLLLAEYEDGTKMSHKQVMDELVTLFVAGHETTSNALTWTFYLLAIHPEIQIKLQHELDSVLNGKTAEFSDLKALAYTEMVVKESMRLLPPVWSLNTRQANENTVVGDFLFPRDKVIFIAPYSNHTNPKYFPEPDKFDPERFSAENEKSIPKYAYIPFGAGSRVCIGQAFAMMEAKLILASIVQCFDITLAEGQALNPQAQITLSNKDGMKVNIKRREN
ncbi:MAG: cytochrome P450 [Pseudohongiellaceae bacterium]|jgi:cytochrome P450